MSAANLATTLDREMLSRRRVDIAPGATPDEDLPRKSGPVVSFELGGRFLLRYVSALQLGSYLDGSSSKHWVCPTPYSPADVVSQLALPDPGTPRTHVMLMNPARLDVIQGPRYVRGGAGIEYILPEGFTKAALVLTWEVVVS